MSRARALLSPRLLVPVLVLLMVVAGVWGARAMLRTEPVRFTALFESAIGLYPGSDVQVLGVPVGRVTAVEADGEVVRVSLELDPDHRVAADTAAVIIAPTMVSDRFVQLTHPWVEDEGTETLPPGTELGLDRTAVPVEIDDIYDAVLDLSESLGPRGANREGALSDLLKVGADNLEGQGKGLNAMFREFGEASATLSDIDDDFFATIAHLDQLNTMLAENDEAVRTVNQRFADVAAYLAEDRDDLGRAARNMAGAMAELDDFLRENRKDLKTSVENLVPSAKALRKQRASLEESVRLMPLLMHNFLDAYDPVHNVVLGRGNLNEATIWASDGLSARTSENAPSGLLPAAGQREGGDR